MGTRSKANPTGERVLRNRNVSWRALSALVLAAVLTGNLKSQTAPPGLPLLLPSAIAFDAQGNLFIADAGAHVVRRLSPSNTETVVAGTGVQGFAGDGGPAVKAELDSPRGLVLGADGNLYISDTHNRRIRMVSAASGLITTVAGSGGRGYSGDGASALAASLDMPTALALDRAGNLYLADTNNHRIRKLDFASGQITTVAGDGIEGFSGDNGPATAASIDSPSGLAVDAVGNLYLADSHNHRVRFVSAGSGLISTLAGNGALDPLQDGGPARSAALAMPRGLTLDANGYLYIADSANQRIRRISPTGQISTVAGEGTQAFGGDAAEAASASLDTPRAVAISPSGLVTLADSHNQRVRQLGAAPSPGALIHTLPWIASVPAAGLTLSGATPLPYGTGTIAAALTAAPGATGGIQFTDTVSGVTSVLAIILLDPAGTANLSVSALAAGTHGIQASYGGDGTHGSALSTTFFLVVNPQSITAAPVPLTILYGQPVPPIDGALIGVLAQDTGKVAVTFTAGAGLLAPAGTYPVAATLTGIAAANYVVSITPANLTIARAPSVTTLSVSSGSPAYGSSVTLNLATLSSTAGKPGGSVVLNDGTTLLGTAVLSAGGTAAFTNSTLAAGPHSLLATYAGDVNFLGGTSAASFITVGTMPDSSIVAVGATSQTIPGGSTATFQFSETTQGLFSSPILLTVQGIPLAATSSLNPATIVPGTTSSQFVLTIQTPLAANDNLPAHRFRSKPARGGDTPSPVLLAVILPPFFGFRNWKRISPLARKSIRIVLSGGICILLASFAIGCGDRTNTTSGPANATTYTITVTGTATGPAGIALRHSANVTLEVL